MEKLNRYYNVVVGEVFKLNMLTLIQIKKNSLFEFVYLFDVWVNQNQLKLLKLKINYFNINRLGCPHS